MKAIDCVLAGALLLAVLGVSAATWTVVDCTGRKAGHRIGSVIQIEGCRGSLEPPVDDLTAQRRGEMRKLSKE